MTKRERIEAAVACRPVDRVPYSLWYHFRLTPPAGPNMAAAELDFYHRYDPDLLKVMHDIPYEMPPDMPEVRSADDWLRLPVLDGRSGSFGQQRDTVKQIMAGRGDGGPVIDTVFGVFSTAQKLCGGRTLELLSQDPARTATGLQRIAQSLANYARALVEAGADGIYLAISGAASDTMSADDYRQHFLPHDQLVLDAASAAQLNVAHHHGAGIYPDLVLGLRGYHVYSWSNRLPGNPGIREMRLRSRACLMCGVDETTFAERTPEQVVQEARDAIAETKGIGFIVAPGCAVPTPPASPDENLRAFRTAAGA